jgi:putative hydrolase
VKIKQMSTCKDLEADLHIHTVSSGHAYSTVTEIIAEAQRKGLKTIAITDHGPAMPGGAHPYHFSNLRVVESMQNGVRILKGVEANIIDTDGTLDLPKDLLDNMDLVLVAFHIRCGYEDFGPEINTQALIQTLQKYKVSGIAHPGNPTFKLDFEKVAEVAKEKRVFVEFNNSSYLENTARKGAFDLDLELAKMCKKHGTNVAIASDAHIAADIGTFEKAWNLLKEVDLAESQILNLNNEKLLEFLHK